jgi:diguanylate cyclase (GGDEF)-like protein/PAS domain S-box-containing protein
VDPLVFPEKSPGGAPSPGVTGIVVGHKTVPPSPLTVSAPISLRPQLILIAVILLTTCALIFTALQLLNRADHSRQVQVAVWRVEAHANLISSLEWEVRAQRGVTPQALTEFRHSEDEILRAMDELGQARDSTSQLRALRATCSKYIVAVNREVALFQSGQIQQAISLDDTAVDPVYRELQKLADLISNQQSQAAERTARISRVVLAAVVLLSTLMMVMYFRRFHREQQRTQVALAERAIARKNEDRLRTLTEYSTDIILITNPAGDVCYLSPSVHWVLGWDTKAAQGCNIFDWIHDDDKALAQATVAATETSSTVEFRLGHANGQWLDFSCLIRNLVCDSNVGGMLFNARDITQDKRKQEALDFNASHDTLTRLPNRAVFMDRLNHIIEQKKRHPQQKAAVLFVDIDDFKVLNDTLGHDAGDTFVQQFGDRLRACVRGDNTIALPGELRSVETIPDTIARLGGDEFIVLLEDVQDPSDAIRVAERIQAAMGEPFMLQGQEVFKSVSIGIAFATESADARTLIANADTAMYRAKIYGKSRFEVYDARMNAQIIRRLDLEKALHRALERKELRLYYQPIVSLATGRVAGLEALLRWDRPGVGMVPPGEFVPLAEQTGLIVQIGQWVLVEACRQAVKWQQIGVEPGPFVSVNVSSRQFAYPAFLDQVKDALRDTGLDPRRLKVELTEGTAMEDPERAVEVMLQLARLGITLSLDDFGTGHSSLSVLRRFPVKTIKIDRSFIMNIHSNSQVAAIVTTICRLARILCMEVVAEGLENVAQLEKLRSISCDFAQGYLLAMPLPPDAVPSILRINLIERMDPGRALAAAAAK